jgi:hypothetical protein
MPDEPITNTIAAADLLALAGTWEAEGKRLLDESLTMTEPLAKKFVRHSAFGYHNRALELRLLIEQTTGIKTEARA